jgi:hypothetical protein
MEPSNSLRSSLAAADGDDNGEAVLGVSTLLFNDTGGFNAVAVVLVDNGSMVIVC